MTINEDTFYSAITPTSAAVRDVNNQSNDPKLQRRKVSAWFHVRVIWLRK
jgi:hypothetical protein